MSKNGSLPKAVFIELQSLKQLCDCSNIIHLYDVFVEETSVCLVTEYAQSDLSELIALRGSSKDYIPRSQIKTLFQQMFKVYTKPSITAMQIVSYTETSSLQVSVNIIITASSLISVITMINQI